MPLILSAFASGLIFGLGLIVSQMVNPAKVLGFLDVFGSWDPSLALRDGRRRCRIGLGISRGPSSWRPGLFTASGNADAS